MKNASLTRYRAWRLWPIHLVAKAMGVLVKVDGLPFGANKKNAPEATETVVKSSSCR
jgi:hypothetical protein